MNIEAQDHQLKLEIEALKEKIAFLKESEERYRLISSVATDYTFSTEVICNKGNYFGQKVVIATARDIRQNRS